MPCSFKCHIFTPYSFRSHKWPTSHKRPTVSDLIFSYAILETLFLHLNNHLRNKSLVSAPVDYMKRKYHNLGSSRILVSGPVDYVKHKYHNFAFFTF